MTRTLDLEIDGLLALLSEEKAALLAGDAAGAASKAREKERRVGALEALLSDGPAMRSFAASRGRLAALARAAADNERLLEAARNGVLSAQSRLRDVLNRERSVGVYAQDGGKLMSAEAGVTRRKTA